MAAPSEAPSLATERTPGGVAAAKGPDAGETDLRVAAGRGRAVAGTLVLSTEAASYRVRVGRGRPRCGHVGAVIGRPRRDLVRWAALVAVRLPQKVPAVAERRLAARDGAKKRVGAKGRGVMAAADIVIVEEPEGRGPPAGALAGTARADVVLAGGAVTGANEGDVAATGGARVADACVAAVIRGAAGLKPTAAATVAAVQAAMASGASPA